MPKRSQAPKHICWDWNLENQENWFQHLRILKMFKTYVHDNSVHNGSYAFPNELMRFRNEAKPIWDKIQKHCINAVII